MCTYARPAGITASLQLVIAILFPAFCTASATIGEFHSDAAAGRMARLEIARLPMRPDLQPVSGMMQGGIQPAGADTRSATLSLPSASPEELAGQSTIRELPIPSASPIRPPDMDVKAALAVAQARADWEWGPGHKPGTLIPLYDTEGRLIAYDVDFTLDGSEFGPYAAVASDWDRFLTSRGTLFENWRKARAEGTTAVLDLGSPRYGSVTVSATFDAPPLRGTRRGVSNYYANGWRASAVASSVLHARDATPTRAILTGSWERLYEFSSSIKRIYVQGQEPYGWYEADDYDRATADAVETRLESLGRSLPVGTGGIEALKDSLRTAHRAMRDNWIEGRVPPRAWVTIAGYNTSFTPYRWFAGCSPTAGAMVVNYYDEASSYGMITRYYSRKVCPVRHQHHCHVSDSQEWMPDAMGTDANGDTWSYNIYPGILNFTNNGCGYNFSGGINFTGGIAGWGFDEARTMINASRPFVWSLTYYPGSGGAGHSAACVGYDAAPTPQEFICYNTWVNGGVVESTPVSGEVSDITWLHGPLPGGGRPHKAKLTSPDGYQVYSNCGSSGFFTCGSNVNILWNNGGLPADHVHIFFFYDGGADWYWVADGTADDGSYNWTVPLIPTTSDSCRVAIFQMDSGGNMLSADGSYGDFTIEPAATLPPATPLSPPNGAVNQPTDGMLDWNDVAGAAGYRIQAGTQSETGDEFDLPASPSHANYSGLEAGQTYYWRVRTRNSSGVLGPYSQSFSFTTLGGQSFVRGDVTADGEVNISDPIYSLVYQFSGGASPPCLKAADDDGSGGVDISDPIYSLYYQFAGGSPPPAPHPVCGLEPTPCLLSCDDFAPCGSKASPRPTNYGGEIALHSSLAGDLMTATITVSTDEALAGFECRIRFDPDLMEFVGVEPPAASGSTSRLGDEGQDPDFRSAHASDGVVRLGVLPDFQMERLWPAGKNEAARIVFRMLHPTGSSHGSLDLFDGILITEDQRQLVPDLRNIAVAGVPDPLINTPEAVRLRLPNPYSPTSPIVLEIDQARSGEISVFSVQGRRVRTLYSGTAGPSPLILRWDGRGDSGEELPSGLYYMQAVFTEREVNRKVLLLR